MYQVQHSVRPSIDMNCVSYRIVGQVWIWIWIWIEIEIDSIVFRVRMIVVTKMPSSSAAIRLKSSFKRHLSALWLTPALLLLLVLPYLVLFTTSYHCIVHIPPLYLLLFISISPFIRVIRFRIRCCCPILPVQIIFSIHDWPSLLAFVCTIVPLNPSQTFSPFVLLSPLFFIFQSKGI